MADDKSDPKAGDPKAGDSKGPSPLSVAPAQKATKSAKCVVGCKLPNGLHAQLDRVFEGPAGKQVIPVGDRVTFNGSNSSGIIGGFGITENVDEEWFDKWMAQNETYHPVMLGLIFKASSLDDAKSIAAEKALVPSGFESASQTTGGVTPATP